MRRPASAFAIVACVLGLSAVGCTHQARSSNTVVLDPDLDDDLGDTGIESGDIRGAADEIARALGKSLKKAPASSRARVAVMPVENFSRFRIDPGLLQNHLTHDLKQQSRNRFDIVAVKGTPRAAQAVLRTEVRGLHKDRGDAWSDYVEYHFTLEDADNGDLLWSGLYETKRLSDVAVVYR